MQKKRKYSITFNEKKFTTKTGLVVNPIMLNDSIESGYAPSVVLQKYLQDNGYVVKDIVKSDKNRHNVKVNNGIRDNYYVIIAVRKRVKRKEYLGKIRKESEDKYEREQKVRERILEYEKRVTLLYHGSDGGIIGDIRCDANRGLCDFGKGFYTGNYLKQAESRVNNSSKPIIYAYEFNMNNKSVYEFTDPILWALFIGYNRNKMNYKGYDKILELFEGILKHDIIIGLIADDKISEAYDNFLSGNISDICLIESLKLVNYGKQYVFKNIDTVNSCLTLKFKYELVRHMKKESLEWEQEVKKDLDDKLNKLKIDYFGKGRSYVKCMEEYNK